MHKKILVLGIIIIFLGTCITLSVAIDTVKEPHKPLSFWKTYYVGGTGPGNYSMIQDAIDDANDDDTVFVFDYSSPYYENLIVNKSLSLIGENKFTTIIDGKEQGDIINISKSNVTLTDFTIKNTSKEGIAITTCSDNTIITNNIINNFDQGIKIEYCNNHIIENNTLHSTDLSTSIFLKKSSNNLIANNTILNMGGGIILYLSSNYNNISGNYIDQGTCYITHTSNYNIWINNSIINHGGMCIYQGSCYNTLKNNIFSNESWECVKITGQSNYNILTNNTFCDSLKGVRIGNSNQNKLYHNRFLNNWQGNAQDNGKNIWDNDYPSGGNYWDDYTDNDYNNDSIGDSPYNISHGSNQDKYPLGYYDYEPPIIDIIGFEENYLYFFNFRLLPLPNATVFIGPAVFSVNVTDDYLFDVYFIDVYVDGVYKGGIGGLNKPYNFTFHKINMIDTFFDIFKHKYTITFESKDCHGNIARKDVIVWLFL